MAGAAITGTTHDYSNDVCAPDDGLDVTNVPGDSVDRMLCGKPQRTVVAYHKGALVEGEVTPKTTTPDGRSVDCYDYRRYGERPRSVAHESGESRAHHRSTTRGKSKSAGTSFGAPYYQSSGGTSTMKQHSTGESNGTNDSRTVTEHYPGAAGWEAQCQQKREAVLSSCLESE